MQDKNSDLLQLLLVIFVIVFLIFILFYVANSDFSSTTQFDKNLSYQEAVNTKNISNCKYIINESLREVCEIKLSNCDSDECKFDKARLEQDESMCYNISDDNLRAGCSSSVKRSSIFESVVVEDNISLCDEFSSDETIQRCKDNYYIAKRFNENNKGYCEKIKNEVIKNECME